MAEPNAAAARATPSPIISPYCVALPMNPVRVGVIGIGNMGWHHARVLSLLRDAELVGVADPNQDRGQLAVQKFD
jgi:predicted homoserine dehydrogenase-like protein